MKSLNVSDKSGFNNIESLHLHSMACKSRDPLLGLWHGSEWIFVNLGLFSGVKVNSALTEKEDSPLNVLLQRATQNGDL